jgi:hypothetical protein
VLSRIVITQIRLSGLRPIDALARPGLEHLEADDAGSQRASVPQPFGPSGPSSCSPAKEVDGSPPRRPRAAISTVHQPLPLLPETSQSRISTRVVKCSG